MFEETPQKNFVIALSLLVLILVAFASVWFIVRNRKIVEAQQRKKKIPVDQSTTPNTKPNEEQPPTLPEQQDFDLLTPEEEKLSASRIYISATGGGIGFREIEVYCGGSNIANQGFVMTSMPYDNNTDLFGGQNLIDGQDGSLFLSHSDDQQPWILLDLGKTRVVDRVVLKNVEPNEMIVAANTTIEFYSDTSVLISKYKITEAKPEYEFVPKHNVE